MTDEGFSGPAIKGQTVYLHDHVDESDVIRALDASTGQEKWRFVCPEPGRGWSRFLPECQSFGFPSIKEGS